MSMQTLIEQFPNQLEEAMEIAEQSAWPKADEVQQIVICGLGGSGIGGTLVQKLVAENARIPIWVNKGYTIPAFVDANTLVIACSYSGNTEETLSAVDLALAQGAKVFCVTSGGALETLAKEKNLPYVLIPGGMPPRACLGYSFVQLLDILSAIGVLTIDWKVQLKQTIARLRSDQESIKAKAEEITAFCKGRIPVLYGADSWQGVLVRWCQQFGENGKMLSWHNVIPEMNHNELVGWRDHYKDTLGVLFFHADNDHPSVTKRMELNEEIVKSYAPVYRVLVNGNSNLERAFYWIHLGDWVSEKIGVARGHDTTEVDVIEGLKKALAEWASNTPA